MENLIILKYQDNFADNLSSFAYGKILEFKSGMRCCYENSTAKRRAFEGLMSNFSLDFEYISTSRVEKITSEALRKNKLFIDDKKIKKELKNKKTGKNKILNLKHFKIDDIDYISDNIKSMLRFNSYDFIVNHDILENILTPHSIGLYLNEEDVKKDKIDWKFIEKATKRLNKYVKQPKLYIFSKADVKDKIKSIVDFEIVKLTDWREEFYFLASCRHKIITNSENSYSECFWSAVLRQKECGINIFDKKLKTSKKRLNWIGI